MLAYLAQDLLPEAVAAADGALLVVAAVEEDARGQQLVEGEEREHNPGRASHEHARTRRRRDNMDMVCGGGCWDLSDAEVEAEAGSDTDRCGCGGAGGGGRRSTDAE